MESFRKAHFGRRYQAVRSEKQIKPSFSERHKLHQYIQKKTKQKHQSSPVILTKVLNVE